MDATFETALAAYKTALAKAEAEVSTDVQRGLYNLHASTVADIEQIYLETRSAYACRLLIEGEGQVHSSDILRGPLTVNMKEAFSKLLGAVRNAYHIDGY